MTKTTYRYSKCYMLGIGGIGMSALARFFKSEGMEVIGYDNHKSLISSELQQEGFQIFYDQNIERLISLKPDLIVYTPAVKRDNIELNYLIENKIPIFKRAEILGEITDNYITLATAGTHGKTSVSGMLAHILKAASFGSTAIIGGILKNYDSNFIEGNNEWLVVEADEFDRSFLNFHVNSLILTSADPDHLDVYQTPEAMYEAYIEFVSKVDPSGFICYSSKNKKVAQLISNAPCKNRFSYGIDDGADYYCDNVVFSNNVFKYNVKSGDDILCEDVTLPVLGLHNVENSIAAIITANRLGVNFEEIKKALLNYKGIRRRFDIFYQDDKLIFINDYAHHPEEVKTMLHSLRQMYPNDKIFALFHPHLYSRTRDFYQEFGESLSIADKVQILPIYPAREKPIEGVYSSMILECVSAANKSCTTKQELLENLEREIDGYKVFITLGAGDIYELSNVIADRLKERK